MSFVASQYAKSTNKKINHSGHLFERRHRAILVQADAYLKELVRYIHLNPLRAGIIDDIADYQWSSHPAYLTGNRPNWLTLDWVLSVFAETAAEARHQYASFMQTECQTAIRHRLTHGADDDHRVLGDDGFRMSFGPEASLSATRQTLIGLTQEHCRKHGISAPELASSSRSRRLSRARAEIGLAAIDSGIATNAEIAGYFNRSQSGLSRAINRLRIQSQQVNK